MREDLTLLKRVYMIYCNTSNNIFIYRIFLNEIY